MGKGIEVKYTVDKRISDMADTINRNLVDKILATAMDKAGKVVQEFMIPELPDGRAPSDKHPRGSRAKQSGPNSPSNMQARFPNHMKESTGVKRLRKRPTNVARVIGVKGGKDGAGQVNFDWGRKARTVGRIHKLWWIDGKHEKFAEVNPRVQRKDIPKIVVRRAGPMIDKIVADEINKGKLL